MTTLADQMLTMYHDQRLEVRDICRQTGRSSKLLYELVRADPRGFRKRVHVDHDRVEALWREGKLSKKRIAATVGCSQHTVRQVILERRLGGLRA